MGNVAGVQDERRRNIQRIDLGNGGFKSRDYIRVCRLIESHVTIADLDKAKVGLANFCRARGIIKAVRLQHSPLKQAKRSRTRPGHALEKSPAVDSILVMVK